MAHPHGFHLLTSPAARPALALALVLAPAVLPGPGCGPAAGPGPRPNATPGAAGPALPADPLEVIEQRVAEAVVRSRESAVALEYTAADAPAGTRRVASGVVINDAGSVLSVRIDPPPADSPPVVARDAAGRAFRATWLAADAVTGLTLLQIPPGVARPAVPASRGPTPGLPVLVIGNPYGLGHSVSRGSVAGLNRRLELGANRLGGLIQVDASLHPGDSGALLVDLRGGWLGVIRSGLAPPPPAGADDDRETPGTGPGASARRTPRDAGGDGDHDLGFAIPACDALWVAGQLQAHGRVDRAYLGVIPATRTVARPAAPGSDREGEPPQGVALDQVLPDTPADRAGLRPGDRIVALGGWPVRSTFDLDDRLARTAAGTELTVEYLRGDGPTRGLWTLALQTTAPPPTDPPKPRTRPRPEALAALGKDRTKDKDRPREARPAPPDAAERIERLERRLAELEAERARRDRREGVARQP